MISLSEIWLYPLKSARGIQLASAELSPTGLAHDRRWMLVDPQGRFISQRECPAMARLEVSVDSGQTGKLNFGWGSEQLQLALPPYQLPHIEVQIWRSKVMAQLFDVGVNAWFSRALMRECRLVYLPDSSFRGTNPDVAPGQRVSFADGYPYLLCNQGSLDDLNQHLRAKGCPTVGIERFRPNLVVSGAKAFAEDNWKQIQIGDIGFELVKPCERCVIISTDQHSGIVGSEPLQTLATYRRQAGKVIFGQNLVARLDCGQVKIADPVRV